MVPMYSSLYRKQTRPVAVTSSEVPTHMIGREFSHYRITSRLGAGGMGEVYRAEDTRLKREVAIKVLPEAFALDTERMMRFEREAQVLASLNHPNIAAIYGLENVESQQFLVLELVEGEDLSERISRGAISMDEALPLFIKIAEALSAAHDKGIVHRDLKPSNVKIRRDGTVKLLDFGLAKATDASDGSEIDLTQSPTLTQGTELGTIMGTAPYMSPEQARGQELDKRSDIWAFGCCLYEALTGERAFVGSNVTDVLASVVRSEPDLTRLPPDTPPRLKVLIERCLRKDADRRLHDIADARIELEDALAGAPADGPGPIAARGSRWPWMIAASGAIIGVAGFIMGSVMSRGPGEETKRTPVRLVVERPDRLRAGFSHREVSELAISPDGQRLVLTGDASIPLRLRSLDSFETLPLAGTEGARSPFFSPDGNWIGFVAESQVKKIPSQGGTPVSLGQVSPVSRGASWGPNDVIVVAPTYSMPLFRIPAGGGPLVPLTQLDAAQNESAHLWPQILPDGDTVVFTVWKGGSYDDAKIERVSLETGERHTLVEGGFFGRVTDSGHLLFVRGGALFADAFDPESGELGGDPVPVLDGVAVGESTGVAQFDVSRNGVLAFIPPKSETPDSFFWVDAEGTAQPIEAAEGRDVQMPRLSPDGTRIAYMRFTDLWLHDLGRAARKRLTFRAINISPEWSPDGSRIAFASTRQGPLKIYTIAADGSDEPQLITSGDRNQVEFPGSWSRDGLLAYAAAAPYLQTSMDIWVVRPGDPDSARAFIDTPFHEYAPKFSPDGRLLAYVSDESGRPEVYVREFPDGGTWSISADGGTEPVWSRDATKLYYRNGHRLMAVPVSVRSGSFSASRPELIFEGDYRVYDEIPAFPAYDVALTGERFLMNRTPRMTGSGAVHVVLDWFEELERLVPASR